MYIPAPFREDDLPTLHALMRRHSFATLVTVHEGRPFATHLPFLLDAGRGPLGTLRAHLARANPQWQGLEDGGEVLVIFQGPHAYVSPSWYETQPNVPTWNYVAVHAYGPTRLLNDEELAETLRQTVSEYETPQPQPWTIDALPDEYVRKMSRAIVGFEIALTRLEGKAKMSQNKPVGDRRGVIAALQAAGDPDSLAVAAWMGQSDEEQT